MERLNDFKFYELGLATAREAITGLLSNLPLPICKAASSELLGAINAIVLVDFKDASAQAQDRWKPPLVWNVTCLRDFPLTLMRR